MNGSIEYKGYIGSLEFSAEDGVLFGKVLGIRALISYEGNDVKSLVEDFHGAVDDYLALCEAEGMKPEKAYKGSFNVRISPELHRNAALRAQEEGVSLNSFVGQAIREAMKARA